MGVRLSHYVYGYIVFLGYLALRVRDGMPLIGAVEVFSLTFIIATFALGIRCIIHPVKLGPQVAGAARFPWRRLLRGNIFALVVLAMLYEDGISSQTFAVSAVLLLVGGNGAELFEWLWDRRSG